jgi:hypothetical protein
MDEVADPALTGNASEVSGNLNVNIFEAVVDARKSSIRTPCWYEVLGFVRFAD